MTIKTTCAAAAFAVVSLGSLAQAASYEFTSSIAQDIGVSERFTATSGPRVTAWAGSSGIFNDGLATLTQNGNGLGLNGRPDLNPWQLDGFPIGSSEFITFNFDWAVNLLGIGFLNVDKDDQFDYAINGGDFVNSVTIGKGKAFFDLPLENVRTLVIRASGSLLGDGAGNDNFSIARISVSAVPLPAGGVLLLGALAAVAALRRRKA